MVLGIYKILRDCYVIKNNNHKKTLREIADATGQQNTKKLEEFFTKMIREEVNKMVKKTVVKGNSLFPVGHKIVAYSLTTLLSVVNHSRTFCSVFNGMIS